MKILLRNKFTFVVNDIKEMFDFHNGKYQDVVYLTGYNKELNLIERTIVMSKSEFNKKKV